MSAANLDPELTGEQLQELAAAQPELAPEILNHPNCYPELAEWINSYVLASPEAVPAATEVLPAATAAGPEGQGVVAGAEQYEGAPGETTQFGATLAGTTQLAPVAPTTPEGADSAGVVLPAGAPGTPEGVGAPPPPNQGALSKKTIVLWAGIGTVIVVLLGVLAYVVFAGGSKSAAPAATPAAKPSATSTTPTTPTPTAPPPPPADAEAIKNVDFTSLTWKGPGYNTSTGRETGGYVTYRLSKTSWGSWCSPDSMDTYLCFDKKAGSIFYVDLDGDKRLDAVTGASTGVGGIEGGIGIYHAWLWDPQSQKPVQQQPAFYTFQSGEYATRKTSFTSDPKYPNAVNIHFDDWLDFSEGGLEAEPKKVPNTAEDRVFGWKDGKMVQLAGKTGKMTMAR